MTDFQLTQWFRRGWLDEATGHTSTVPDEADAAYSLGAKSYTESMQYFCRLTDEQILKIINK